jgi:type III restriction enzyme
MPKRKVKIERLPDLPLVDALKGEVEGWVNQGWPGTTQTTADLLNYWFGGEFSEEAGGEFFYDCQQRAVETVIYCHEILKAKTLAELYEKLAPEILQKSEAVRKEVESIPFEKYALKMATGSGKTWVLACLLVWQYFNALRGERVGDYSFRFLVVAPGLEVLNRLLDSFKGKKDPKTETRDPETSDYKRKIFMPDGPQWRDQFHLEILEPQDVRPNTSPPEGPFVLLTNWQQFRLKPEGKSLWEKYTGEDVEEEPRGEFLLNYLSEFPDLVIMNDEAHHVHGKKANKGDAELVWRTFINKLHQRFLERHKNRGEFLQIDYSATPFYGSAEKREYFPHIVYDYPLLKAMEDMLVKQIFLEKRERVAGEDLIDTDFRAKRKKSDGRRIGEIIGLSDGQKVLIQIGLKKLEEISNEFREKGIDKKPVMLILAEETDVADLVFNYLGTLTDSRGKNYGEQAFVVHSEKEEEEYRWWLDNLDLPESKNPKKIVISVLMLREGFDKKNISVITVLRASEADILLEQIVGRGLRQMFPYQEYPEFWEAKREAMQAVRQNQQPPNSLDFLFIVEHPRFNDFYEKLRKQGYIIGEGNTEGVSAVGDIITVNAEPERIKKYDIWWPTLIYDQTKLPDLGMIKLEKLPKYPVDFDLLKKQLSKPLSITEEFAATGVKTKTWKFPTESFDYNFFLSQTATAVSKIGKNHLITAGKADIAGIIDDYVSNYLFGQKIDFMKTENYSVLRHTPIFDFVVDKIRGAIVALFGEIVYEYQGKWDKLSSVDKLMIRADGSIKTNRCIYPLLGFSKSGGLERDFAEKVLNKSAEVEAFSKIFERRHSLNISYRDEYGITRDYYPDFIVKTNEAMCIVEMKADKDLDLPTVALKAQAAKSWCERVSLIKNKEINQPNKWKYFLISESLFKDNKGLSFNAFAPLAEGLAMKIVAQYQKRLFI